LGIEVTDIFYIPLETSLVEYVKRIYLNEEITTQFIIGSYRIDIYFIKYKLAIECDEYFHIFQKEDDIKRETFIINQLNCKFIRFSQNGDRNINISELIKNINSEIYKNKDEEIYRLKLENDKLKIENNKLKINN